MATSRIFHDFLVEEFEKRNQNVDIVGTKRKHFESLLNKAHNSLREKDVTDAKQCFFDIIEYLRNEPYHDELDLSADVEFCIKCCFCYSSVTDPLFCQEMTVINTFTEELINTLLEEYSNRLFPKYLKVLLSYKRKDWITTLYWCNIIINYKEEEANYQSVDFFKELLPSQSEITSSVEIYEEKAFYGYGQKLANKFSSKKFDQKCNLYDDENFLSTCDQCMRNKIQQYILKEQPTFKENKIMFGKILHKFVDLYQEIRKCNFTDINEIDLYNKIRDIEDLVTNGIKNETKPDDKLCIGQTQTDKIKSGNKFVQTEGVKSKNAEVQVHLESQTLNTLLDVKNKLLITQEKKETINKLNKKINELYEKVNKETNKRKSAEEEFQRNLAKQEFEINMLKNMLNEYDIERKQEREKNISLQKLFVEQTNDKFNMQKNIYKTFERKSVFMVNYLRGINRFLTPNSIPSDVVIKQNIDIWEGRSKKIQEDLTHLNSFYKNVMADMIKSDQFNVTWPDMPEFPGDEDNIVFVSFKPAIKNIIDIEAKLFNNSRPNIQCQPHVQTLPTLQYNVPRQQYPLQNSPFYIGSRFIYQNPPASIIVPPNKPPQQYYFPSRERVAAEMHMQHQQSHVEQNPNLNKNLKAIRSTEILHRTDKEIIAGCSENLNNTKTDATSTKIIAEKDKSSQKKEEILFEYVYASCFGATEMEVTLAMLQVVDDNDGTLSKLSKEQILEEVKRVLRTKRQSAWVVPKSPHVEWNNDHSEHNCSICFEEFSLSETYTLQCQHEYHKECIKKWLKTSSVCPICRLHSVIDDEFPPLH